MKKLNILLISLLFIFGFTQCKKNVDTISPGNLGEAVHITLNVGDGDKHIVYPGTGAVVYTDADVIYVGNNGKYIGYLEYEDGAFHGTIYDPSDADYLHFYFVGGLTPSDTPEVGTTTDFTVDIADQSSRLPVLSYAHSTQKYVDGTTTYGCTLLNKCGLVKFKPATATSESVTVGGMKTAATIDFSLASPGIRPTTGENPGIVTLFAEDDATKWAILLPQDAVKKPAVSIAGYFSKITNVPTVTNNMYYTTGVDIAMSVEGPYIDAEYTAGSDKKIKFSRGNLQYLGTGTSGMETPRWRIADHQYDVMGNGSNGNVTISGYDKYNTGTGYNTVADDDYKAARDLFGWGTSGWNNGNYFYQPYSTSIMSNDTCKFYNGYGYGPTNGDHCYFHLSGDYANADWGVYNRKSGQDKMENGGDFAWRTPTGSEWSYVFFIRKTQSGHRYVRATVCNILGILLLPDDWDDDTYPLTDYNTYSAEITGNNIDASDWAILEGAGCVFLPAAGYRGGKSINSTGKDGYYWSSEYGLERPMAQAVRFYLSVFNMFPCNRNVGNAVRLIYDVE